MWGRNRYTAPGKLFAKSVIIKIELLEKMLQYVNESGIDEKSRLEQLSKEYSIPEDRSEDRQG